MGRSFVFSLILLSLVGCAQQQSATSSTPTIATQTYTASDVQKAYDDAKKFRDAGQYEKSLERHIWYHENAVRYDQSQSAVRLSFALSDWADLAKVYPKALDALKATRDKAVATYRKDPMSNDQFEEAMSIDFAIDDLASAKTLYYEGKKHGEDSHLLLELDRIVDAGELAWAKDIIGDPIKFYEDLERDSNTTGLSGSQDKEIAKSLDALFSTEVAKLIQTVAKVYDLPTARNIQARALKHLDTPEIRNAVK